MERVEYYGRLEYFVYIKWISEVFAKVQWYKPGEKDTVTGQPTIFLNQILKEDQFVNMDIIQQKVIVKKMSATLGIICDVCLFAETLF